MTPRRARATLRFLLSAVLAYAGTPAVAFAATGVGSLSRPDARVDADHVKRDVPHHRTFGMSMDLGLPDGAALGLVVRPQYDWLRIGAAVTHNGMAPGARFGVTLDPISFPVGPTVTVEGGHYWPGTLPTVKDSPLVAYNYANFHLGLEVGSRATFRFFLRGGASWLDVRTTHFQGAGGGGGSLIGDPSYSGWLAPSGKLGFSAYF